MMECPHRSVFQQITEQKLCKRAWRATTRLQGHRERERGWFKLNALAACTATLWTMVRVWWSCDKAGLEWPLPVTVRQQDVCWLQVHAWHDSSYITETPLLAHCLSVKLSACQCSHSCLAGQIATCLWEFQMQFATRSGSPQDDSAPF